MSKNLIISLFSLFVHQKYVEIIEHRHVVPLDREAEDSK